MPKPTRTPGADVWGLVLRYGGAVLAVAVAAGLRWPLHGQLDQRMTFVTFHPLVALVAMLAGGGPGVLATVISVVVADLWVIAPDGVHGVTEAVGIGFFAASGLVMSAMGELLRRARERDRAGLEDQVAARTDDRQRPSASLQREVEDRQRAERSLGESERRFRTVFEHAATGIAITTLDAVFERCNPAYCALLGYTEEEFRRTPFASLVHPDDREANLTEIRRLRAGEVPSFEIENRYVHKSGRPVWVRKWVSQLPDAAGEPAHLLALVTDTTDRRRAEQALRASEERFKTLAGSAPVGIYETDADGNCLFVNDRWCRNAGMTPEAARGLGWADALHPEDRDRVFGWWHEAARTGREFAGEYRFRTPGGAVTWLAGRAVAVRDAAGAVTGYIGTVADVTERKQAEDALRASEERLRLAVRASHVGLWDWDPRTNATHYSPEWKSMLGYDEADIGSDDGEWERRVHPDDLAPALDRVRALMTGAEVAYEAEFRMRHRDGSWRWIFARGEFVRDATGAPTRLLGCHVDVTRRKQAEEAVRRSEQRLRAILNTAADAVLTADGEGVVQSVNPAAARMFGYTAAEMTGRNVSMLVPPPWRAEQDGYLARYWHEGVANGAGTGREVAARRKDGAVFPAELTVSEVDQLSLFTWIVRDLTRRKELERDVVEVVSQEQRRIGQDLHDSVGQELTALSLLADDLAETLRTDPSGGADLVGRMARGLQRSQEQLRAVMRGLLPVAVHARGLMAALADLVDRTGNEGKAACTFDCPEPISVADNVIATQLYLIAQEAVRNAVKHARPRHVSVTMESSGRLILRVRDDGSGMPARPTDLQGLGLRIMRNRAAIIGAALTIGPAAPTGTVVTCVLARTRDE